MSVFCREVMGVQVVLLSGGSGKRLWPLSNGVRSKQFLKVFQKNQYESESMLQRVYRQLRDTLGDVRIIIATAASQVSAIRNQIAEDVEVSVEPCRRDTFPAILLAALFLRDKKHQPLSEIVLVCPVDPYVGNEYFSVLREMEKISKEHTDGLVLMGIQPTYPSEKYGYILMDGEKAQGFREKPSVEDAVAYIAQGALWNSGVFAFRLGYFLECAGKVVDFSGYAELREKYASLPAISFDYAIAECEERIWVVRYGGAWKDLGTWNTLTEAMPQQIIGNAILDDTCQNVHVINELDVPLLCMGLENVIVSASPDGILVTNNAQSSYIKPYVEQIMQPVMYAEKSWGTYRVLDVGEESLTIKVVLNPGHKMHYHSHERREEIWNIVEGEGVAMLDGEERAVHVGTQIAIPRGMKHSLRAVTVLRVIEVQLGKDISVEDKTKHPYP